ncbi:hypothetical protein FUAX_55470 (plasmid) [Fulvitalea axinellae]|uniref:site-specific DNA-methyltransferase (adenine-specific) n=1 Tax=Fulvitalea axinellae TaxID=1182444 RepID=A0AAU9CVQ1_9BACT|nr:hypothetical protein FUAX_55470 [Fulvitalea axinellae]
MRTDQQRDLFGSLWKNFQEHGYLLEWKDRKAYLLGLVFYKFLCDNQLRHLRSDPELYDDFFGLEGTPDMERRGANRLEVDITQKIGYFIYPDELLTSVWQRDERSFFNEGPQYSVERALYAIESRLFGSDFYDSFAGIFSDINFTQIRHLGKSTTDGLLRVIDFLASIPDDQLDYGMLFDFLLEKFAEEGGRKRAEVRTPASVSELLTGLVTANRPEIQKAYDPACGNATLLIDLAKKGGVQVLMGQEINRSVYNIARMNLMAHGVHPGNIDIQLGNTLEEPSPEHNDIRFDAVVSVLPFNTKWRGIERIGLGDRFMSLGGLAPKSRADYAFVQHMIQRLDEHGIMAVILPSNALFRGNAEARIRRFLIEDRNYLDAVIELPANIFHGTSTSTSILVFKKDRTDNNVLFINASRHFEKAKFQNHLRPEDIQRILSTYSSRRISDDYSHQAPLSEIASNDYNLSISRYIYKEGDSLDPNKIYLPLSDVITQVKGRKLRTEELSIKINVLDLSPDPFDVAQSFTDKEKEWNSGSGKLIEEDTFLFAFYNDKVYLTQFKYTGTPIFIRTGTSLPFKLKIGRVDPNFFIREMFSDYMKQQLRRYVSGTTAIQRVSFSNFRKVRVEYLPLNEQISRVKEANKEYIQAKELKIQAERERLGIDQAFYTEAASLKHSLGHDLSNFSSGLSLLEKHIDLDKVINPKRGRSLRDVLEDMKQSKNDITQRLGSFEKRLRGKEPLEETSLSDVIEAVDSIFKRSLHFRWEVIKDITDNPKDIKFQWAPESFNTVLKNIRQNALDHAFKISNPDRDEIAFEVTILVDWLEPQNRLGEQANYTRYIALAFKNNGAPFPKKFGFKGLTESGQTTDRKNHSGVGGSDILRLMEQMNGKFELSTDDDAEFPVTYRLLLPLI